jgi:amino acid transporter
MNSDDQVVIDAGYKPQLNRTVGFFSSFAVGFSFMSVLMGTFASFGFVLNNSGPFGFWTWLIVGVGQLLVALIFAEMASRLPLTGSLYNWNMRLSNPTIAWIVAWTLTFAYAVSGPGVILVLIAPLQTLLGISFSSTITFFLVSAIILVQLLINMSGVKLAAYINKLAVIAEIGALIVICLLVAVVLILKGGVHPEFLTTIPTTPAPYLPAFLLAILLPAFTIFGFESPSDLSEETVNVKHIAPRSIISAVIASIVLGFGFIVLLTIAIPDLAMVTASADPISAIVAYHLGEIPTKLFLICVIIAVFAVALLNMTLASRLLFAVARDDHFFAAKFFSKISKNKVPANATIAVAVIEIAVFYFFSGFAALYAAPIVLLEVAYLITVSNFARKSKALPTSTTFSLGAWHKPVIILAILWLIVEIYLLTVPESFRLSAYISGGVILVGIAQYAFLRLLKKEKA